MPFGGLVEVEGFFFFGYYYRVKVHKSGELPTTIPFCRYLLARRWDFGSDPQVSSGGFFKYADPRCTSIGCWPTG